MGAVSQNRIGLRKRRRIYALISINRSTLRDLSVLITFRARAVFLIEKLGRAGTRHTSEVALPTSAALVLLSGGRRVVDFCKFTTRRPTEIG